MGAEHLLFEGRQLALLQRHPLDTLYALCHPYMGAILRAQTMGHRAHAIPCLVSLFLCEEGDNENLADLTRLSREPSPRGASRVTDKVCFLGWRQPLT